MSGGETPPYETWWAGVLYCTGAVFLALAARAAVRGRGGAARSAAASAGDDEEARELRRHAGGARSPDVMVATSRGAGRATPSDGHSARSTAALLSRDDASPQPRKGGPPYHVAAAQLAARRAGAPGASAAASAAGAELASPLVHTSSSAVLRDPGLTPARPAAAVGGAGVLLGFGRNMEGQLGLGSVETMGAPVQVDCLSGATVALIACGSYHSFVVLGDGTVLAMGEGGDGQLGIGNQTSPKRPQRVEFFRGRVTRRIACGEQHTLFACDDGLYVCGKGEDGQLGLGDRDDQLAPQPLPLCAAHPGDVQHVACGSHHSALVFQGSLFCFGWNRFGQLGTGAADDSCCAPAYVGFFHGKRFMQLACGVQHTAAICDDGVYAWGGNTYGQLGLGNFTEQNTPQRIHFFDGRAPVGVSCWFHTAVWCQSGEIFCFGEGNEGKLGNHEDDDQAVPVLVPSPTGEGSWDGVSAVVAGSEHTCVIVGARVHIWGGGDGGKLGHGGFAKIPGPEESLLATLPAVQPRIVSLGVDHTLIYGTPWAREPSSAPLRQSI